MEQSTFTLFEIVRELGIPAKEVRQRFANKQLKINNVLCTALDHKVCVQDGYWELGDFIVANELDLGILKITDIKDFFGEEPTNIKALEFLTGYTLISISKKEHFVFMNTTLLYKYG